MQSRSKKTPVFIFDIGGVVIIWRSNDPIFKYVADRYEVPFARMQFVMNQILPELEAGEITSRQFVVKSLGATGRKLRPRDDPDRLITIPFAKRAKSRKGVIKMIQNLTRQGYEVYAFSNTNKVHLKLMKQRGWTTPLFRRFFASCYLGLLKPDPGAYRKVLKIIHAKQNDVIFVDNSERNVRRARLAGIRHSIRFHSISDLKKNIKRALLQYSH
jgi:putative hydrolase of the HAD superfamily